MEKLYVFLIMHSFASLRTSLTTLLHIFGGTAFFISFDGLFRFKVFKMLF